MVVVGGGGDCQTEPSDFRGPRGGHGNALIKNKTALEPFDVQVHSEALEINFRTTHGQHQQHRDGSKQPENEGT